MKIIGILQARMGSSRLPGKVMAEINGKPGLYWIIERARQSRLMTSVMVATSTRPENDPLEAFCVEYGYSVFRGDEDDVLSRYAELTRLHQPGIVVRLTGDNFAVDPDIIDMTIQNLIDGGYDIATPYFEDPMDAKAAPFGAGCEVATGDAVLRLAGDTQGGEPSYREHIFTHAFAHLEEYKVSRVPAPPGLNRPDVNVTCDTEPQLRRMRRLYEIFRGREVDFRTRDVIAAWPRLAGHPEDVPASDPMPEIRIMEASETDRVIDLLAFVFENMPRRSLSEGVGKAHTVIVAETDTGDFIGCCWCRDAGIPELRIGGIGGVAVLPEFRGAGLAAALVRRAIDAAPPCDGFLAWSRVPGLFERLGFSDFSDGIEVEEGDSTPFVFVQKQGATRLPGGKKWARIKF